MIVAGDIGGTKTHLALFDWSKERVDPVRLESFHSADYTSLEDMLTEFLVPPKPPTPIDEFATEKSDAAEPEPERSAGKPPKIDAACFGVAGPVIQNHCSDDQPPVGGRWRNAGETVRHTESEAAQRSRSHGTRDSVAPTGRNRNPQRWHSSTAQPGARPDRCGNRTGRVHPLLERFALSAYAVGRGSCGLRTEQ